jgi:hypothetical protein
VIYGVSGMACRHADQRMPKPSRRFPAGYRLPRRRRFKRLSDVLWTRRHERVNKRLYARLDAGVWPRNPVWRFTYDPLRPVFQKYRRTLRR